MSATLQPEQNSALILGGARSGKSAYAEQMVLACGNTPHYVATSQIFDDEMKQRVQQHQHRRGTHWSVTEEPLNLREAIEDAPTGSSAILVDCLTLWLSNLMHHERNVDNETSQLLDLIPGLSRPIVFVSNEVGMGIVPENALARSFRDHQGRLNQKLAVTVDRVDFIAAGLPLNLKPQRTIQ
ncbi:bifunctional adenosylcobinamide kinase/adenosylcobinamide-phosphate guanylyltransferase [Pararhizobium sp. IMCC21322]|uniref:bifunctional adenosylcobinamide kinase/adenosylcobinamide-phosphate guanylyltransferase n=1 Tax=Pararhizobium sp. IMCC21322 TaxID=3067903 RepID=UPI0027418121|nr:bifunctional adenosylcobinamide kinase/adenosylcobinamide-phosphate guanylyltransferase [Pararhizobium sp. IMCC21322]